jgi:hypothetical protein
LSTLTKVLVVLLTVFSIFLCGIVVTYVGTSENYKKKFDDRNRAIQSAQRSEDEAKKDLETEKARAANEKTQLDKQLTDLGVQTKSLLAELDSAKRENAQLVQKVAVMAGTVEMANATAKQQTVLFETAQKEVRTLQADQTDRQKELEETSEALDQRRSIVAQLEEKVRELTQENQELLNRLNRGLQPLGQMTTRPPTTVGTRPATVQPVQAAPLGAQPTRPINLNGRVTAVDMKNRWAEISIGSAAGVRQDMTFHIIRGDRWAAKMLIREVSPDKAVGTLQLVQIEPQIGDAVTTNL